MPKLNEMFGGSFLKAADLQGKMVKVVIEAVEKSGVLDRATWYSVASSCGTHEYQPSPEQVISPEISSTAPKPSSQVNLPD